MSSTLVKFFPKVRRRMPAFIGQSKWMSVLEDRVAARAFFSSHDVARLERRQSQCRTPGEFYDFTLDVFPSHQIRCEITQFLEFAAKENPAVVAEIGTAEGGTNFLLGQALQSTEAIFGIDLFVRNTALLRQFNARKIEQCFLDASSYAPETVTKVVDLLGKRKLDLLFIDGDHTYQGVKSDFYSYCKLVREGGLIAFHDVVPDHLTRFGRRTGRWAGEVPVFWSEVKGSFENWEFVEDTEQDGLGIGVIRYSTDGFSSLRDKGPTWSRAKGAAK